MTKKEYADYQKTVKDFFKCKEIHFLHAIQDEEGDYEEYFSWRSCDCCDSHLGGSRIDVDTVNDAGTVMEFSVCSDCYHYSLYGRLDDMTMQSLED